MQLPSCLPRPRAATLACAAALTTAACDPTPRAPERAADDGRDSAGIHIVEHHLGQPRDSIAPTWRLAAAPELRIGDAVGDSTQELDRVSGAALLADGRLAIGVGSGPGVRLYDASGRLVRTIGRRGEGPGELLALDGPWVADGGRLSVFDQRQLRLILFDTSGVVVRAADFRPQAGDGAVIVDALGGTSDGGVVAMAQVGGEWKSGRFRPPVSLFHLDSAGERTRVAGPLPGREIVIGPIGPGGAGSLASPPFARTTLAAACGAGVATADNGAYEVRLTGADGAPRTIVRADVSPAPLTDEAVRALISAQLRGRVPVTDRMVADARGLVEHGELPVLDALRCDRDGNLWVVELAATGAASRRVASYAPDGRLRGVVWLPATAQLRDADGDRVVLQVVGADGVEVVEVRRLTTPSG